MKKGDDCLLVDIVVRCCFRRIEDEAHLNT